MVKLSEPQAFSLCKEVVSNRLVIQVCSNSIAFVLLKIEGNLEKVRKAYRKSDHGLCSYLIWVVGLSKVSQEVDQNDIL